MLDVKAVKARNQIEDIAAFTRGSVCPQAGLLAVDYDLKTPAWTPKDVADMEFPVTHFAGGE